jgi:hypothetical protein
MAQKTLEPKRYNTINAFHPTAAFSYDSAGQLDEIQIACIPLKAMTTKFFHHLCSGYA